MLHFPEPKLTLFSMFNKSLIPLAAGESSKSLSIVPMTNADVDECARLMCDTSAYDRKHTRYARGETTRHLAELLAAPGAYAYVCRDARCLPVAFAIGRREGDCLHVCELCVAAHLPRDHNGLRLLQHIQNEIGASHTVLDKAQGNKRVAHLLRVL